MKNLDYFIYHQVGCKILATLVQYTSTSNYLWMLCEGIYLHTLIIVAVFVGEQQLFWYYVLGWGESDTFLWTTTYKTYLISGWTMIILTGE